MIGCKLLWTSFYDDYICFSRPTISKNTEQTVIALFKLLGWQFAETGDKCKPFQMGCEALGVVFSLEESCNRCASVRNTAKRVEELSKDLKE